MNNAPFSHGGWHFTLRNSVPPRSHVSLGGARFFGWGFVVGQVEEKRHLCVALSLQQVVDTRRGGVRMGERNEGRSFLDSASVLCAARFCLKI